MTAGIAANRPNAVAIRASAMPGATARNVATFALARPANEVITPQTVPNSPTKGVTDAVVARKVIRLSSRVNCADAARCRVRWSAAEVNTAVWSASPPWDCDFLATGRNKSAPALKTGTKGVKRNVSAAVLISERLWALRKIFQNV